MNFDTYFRLTSYATIFAATLALYIAGGVGSWLALVFVIAMIMAWSAEGSRWQLSERTALIVILVSLPIFYFDWRILTPYLQTDFLEASRRGSAEVAVPSEATKTIGICSSRRAFRTCGIYNKRPQGHKAIPGAA